MRRTPLKRVGRRAAAKKTRRAEVVAEVLERDGFQCQFPHWTFIDPPVSCVGGLEVHEIVPRSAWPDGELEPSNCITLSHSCHAWVTDHPKLSHELGLHKFSWERPS